MLTSKFFTHKNSLKCVFLLAFIVLHGCERHNRLEIQQGSVKV